MAARKDSSSRRHAAGRRAAPVVDKGHAQQGLALCRDVLEIAARHTERIPLLKELVSTIQDYTGCAAVGIRILDAEGNIPYEARAGFSERFYELESPLSIKTDECMCINVIKGRTDPTLPFYTEGGSFFMNGTTRFLATVSEEEKGRTRNACNEHGYESVALVPIPMDGSILGLIHVADAREDMAPRERVEALEVAAAQLGMTFRRVAAEEALRDGEEQLRRLASELSAAEDRERRRVAEGLHDHVGQWLGAMNLHLQALRGAELSEAQGRALDQSVALLKQMGTAVRTMTFELCPPMLHESGLAPALSWLVEQQAREHPVDFRVEDDGQAKPLSDEVAGYVFRAVRELLRNAVRHADPRHVVVSSAREGDVLRTCVADDGKGFDPTSVDLAGRGGAGFGLFSIRERARHMGGRFEIESTPGRGSRFTLLVPMGLNRGEESSASGDLREPRS